MLDISELNPGDRITFQAGSHACAGLVLANDAGLTLPLQVEYRRLGDARPACAQRDKYIERFGATDISRVRRLAA